MSSAPARSTAAPTGVQTVAVLPLKGTTVTATVPPHTSGVAVVDGTTLSFRHYGITLADGQVFSLGFDGLIDSSTTASYQEVSINAAGTPKYDSTRHPTGIVNTVTASSTSGPIVTNSPIGGGQSTSLTQSGSQVTVTSTAESHTKTGGGGHHGHMQSSSTQTGGSAQATGGAAQSQYKNVGLGGYLAVVFGLLGVLGM